MKKRKYTYAEYKALMGVMGAQPDVRWDGNRVEWRIVHDCHNLPREAHNPVEEFRYNHHNGRVRHSITDPLDPRDWHDWGTKKGCCR